MSGQGWKTSTRAVRERRQRRSQADIHRPDEGPGVTQSGMPFLWSGSIDSQAAMLGGQQAVQRQGFLRQISQVQGNRHAQRVVGSLKRSENAVAKVGLVWDGGTDPGAAGGVMMGSARPWWHALACRFSPRS